MWAALINEGRWSGEVINKHKDGHEFTERLTITAIRNGQNEVVNYVAVFTDISEKKEIELKLRHSQKMEAVGTLVSGIAHEFNNMLTGIYGNVFLAKDLTKQGSEIHNILQTADEICFKASDMINQLLTLAHKDKGLQKYHHVDLASWIDDSLKLSRSALPANVELMYTKTQADLIINADKTQLHQIVINLLNNARDSSAHRQSPCIRIILDCGHASVRFRELHKEFKANEFVKLTISDNGTGIPADKLDKIFEPFYTTKEVGKGTGLGLAVIQAVVQSHHGCMEVESFEGKGTSFHIYFPRVTSTQEQTNLPIDGQPIIAGSGELILIADDEPEVLKMTSRMLQNIGYKTVEAKNGNEAIELFKADTQAYDLLLFDMVMPILSGPSAAEHIRRIRPDIPVVFYTGYSPKEMLKELQGLENFKLIGKPFRVGEITGVISGLLKS